MVFASYNNIISPLGFSTRENYEAVMRSETGVRKTQLPFSADPFCVGQIDETRLETTFQNTTTAHTKLEKLSILSIQDVLNQSGLDARDKRLLLVYSTTKGNIDLLETTHPGVSPGRVYLPAMTRHLQQYFQFANTPVVLSNACISGLLAIIMAKRFIEQGLYDHVLVCGGDILSEFTISGFKSFNALSTEPGKPFDANRTGINLGEAVSTILISNNSKLAAPYQTHIVSGFSANDANHISGPSRTGDGLYQSLQQLGISDTGHIGFISAHGTATPFNDEMESIAFERAGFTQTPVNSLKGYYGHTLGAAGVLETVLSLESLKNQTLIKSEGYSTKGVSGNITMIERHQPASFNAFIKTASGFGGCNAAALFQLV